MAREVRLHADPAQSAAQQFFAYILCSLGGTGMSSLLLGQPPGWLAVDRVCLCYVVSFALMRFPPFSSLFLHLFRLPLLLPFLIFFQDVGFSHALTSFGLDRALLSPSSLYAVSANPVYASSAPYFHPATHQSFFSAVVTAWLSATGGGHLRHSLSLLQADWSFSFPHALLSPPSLHSQLALLLSVLYWAVTDAHGWLGVQLLEPRDARFLVIATVVSQVSGKRLLAWLKEQRSSSSAAAWPVDGAAVALVRAAMDGEQHTEGADSAGEPAEASNGHAMKAKRRSRPSSEIAPHSQTAPAVSTRRSSRKLH